jgi:hypothetical protein
VRRVPRLADERGQALVELVACVPVIVLVALAIAQGMLALGASGAAQGAAERARVASGRGDDPVAAARRGLARDATVRVERGVLHVSVPVHRVVSAISLAPAQAEAQLLG